MGEGSNVLWELQPRAQSDVAFHRGADIKMLSQFAAEDEVLFPPCTICLRCIQSAPPEVSATTKGEGESASKFKAVAELLIGSSEVTARKLMQVEDTKLDGNMFTSIKVLPSFI